MVKDFRKNSWIFLTVALTVMGLLGIFVNSSAETNIVPVEECENVNSGIHIKRGGSWTTLTNGCRDAGHGYRNYSLHCTSRKQYQVSWQSCSAPVSVPISMPQPTLVPVQAPIKINNPVPVIEQQVEALQPAKHTIECSGHGWLHDDHCHCNSGYYPSGLQCLLIPSEQPIAQPVIQPSVKQIISPPVSEPAVQAVECNGHGWLHDDHCHCDSGYYPSGLQCLMISKTTSVNTATVQPVTQPTVAAPKVASTPKTSSATQPKAKTVECSGHGWLHGDHCHCDTGYYPSGLECLTIANAENKKSVANSKKKIEDMRHVDIVTAKEIKENPEQCGGHGWRHGDHCHCDEGYYHDAGICVVVPAIPTVQLKNGTHYTKEDFWSPSFSVKWYYWEEQVVITWQKPEVAHDGYFVYVRAQGFPGNLSDYEPVILTEYRQSYIFTPEEDTEYVSYIIPFVYLASGEPRMLGNGEHSSHYLDDYEKTWGERFRQKVHDARVAVAEWVMPEN